MKKITVVLLFIFSAAVCFSFSKPKQNDSVSVKGYIHVYGNEPFTFIGIACDTGEEFSIKADDSTTIELQKTQGYKIEIKGFIENSTGSALKMNELKDGFLVVNKWKKVGE